MITSFKYAAYTIGSYIISAVLIKLGAMISAVVTQLPGHSNSFQETYYTLTALLLFAVGLAFCIFGVARTLNPDNFK